LHTLLDDLSHGLARIELRFLFEKTDGEAGRNRRAALEFLIDAGENPKQRTLSGSIQADDADFRAVKIGKVDVLKNGFLVVVLADSNHGVDELCSE
jgi:hypothetical protein